MNAIPMTGSDGQSYSIPINTDLPTGAGQTAIAAAVAAVGAAQATHADAQALIVAVNNQTSIQAWTDDTGVFFLLNVRGGVFTWTAPTGAASPGPGVGARPAAGASLVVDRATYQATTAGTGYAVGDYLDHVVSADPGTGAVVGHYWLNLTSEAKLAAAPPAASISPVSVLPTGAATDASLQAIRTLLAARLPVDTVVGSVAADRGGTVTAGGSAQQLMAANPARRGWSIQNQSPAALYVNGTAGATTDYHSLMVPAGGYFESSPHHVGTGAMSIIGAMTGQAFYAREF